MTSSARICWQLHARPDAGLGWLADIGLSAFPAGEIVEEANRAEEISAATVPGIDAEREKETLTHIASGYRNCAVAEAPGALDAAERTVASHIELIYRKLGISSQAEASWHDTRPGL